MRMDMRERLTAYASQPHAEVVLFAVAALESVFVPVSADTLLIPMVLLNTDRAFRYAMIATTGSVCGALLGYIIGYLFYTALGLQFFGSYSLLPAFLFLKGLFASFVVVIVISAGFSSIPYKVVTFFSGFFAASLSKFIMAGIVARGARFFLISWLLWRGGTRYHDWLDRNFNAMALAMTLGCLLLFSLIILIVNT